MITKDKNNSDAMDEVMERLEEVRREKIFELVITKNTWIDIVYDRHEGIIFIDTDIIREKIEDFIKSYIL